MNLFTLESFAVQTTDFVVKCYWCSFPVITFIAATKIPIYQNTWTKIAIAKEPRSKGIIIFTKEAIT